MVIREQSSAFERTFTGRTRVDTKREVLAFWHTNQQALGLSLKQFLTHCRMSNGGRAVIFRR